MASFIVSSIHSAKDDLESLQDMCPEDLLQSRFVVLRHRLRNLITFLLCTRKLGNDVHLRADGKNINKDRSLGSLLGRIEEAVCKNAQEIHTYRLRLDDGFSMDVMNEVDHFQQDIESFEKEIDEWYITLSYYSWQSSSPTKIMEIIDSVLNNLVEFLIMPIHNDFLVNLIEDLGEKIKLLRSFIPFATLLGAEHQHLEDLLAHIEAVAVDTAHLTAHHTLTMSYMLVMVFREKWWEGMPQEISELQQRIKPVDPRVCEIYTQALASLKLSRQLHALTADSNDDPINIMRDFIDFLLFIFWEIQQGDACLVASLMDQLLVLYDGLRFLRTTLKERPNKFDENIRHLTGVVICDAGIMIFSLYQKDVKVDLELSDFLGRIKLLRAEFDEKVPEISTFNFPKINELGFVDFLLENLMELTNGKVDSYAQSRVQAIYEELGFLRSFLGEIVEFHNEEAELQALWNRILEVAYRVEFLTDQLVLGNTPDSFSTSFDAVTDDINIIKSDALRIFHGTRKEKKAKNVTETCSHVPSQSIAPITDEVVGFNVEATAIIDRLRRGSKRLRIVAIVGMPGLGKTTLAMKVYNDPSVIHHFHVRAWSTLSQAFDKKTVLVELLNHIVANKFSEMNEQDLAEELRRRLKGRRYLIFLDDLWDIQAWNSLEGSLPDDSNGSRVILTSRLHDVAPHALLDGEPHFLRQLTNDESWELLQKKLFRGNNCPPAFYDLGMQIAEKCKGLPLTIVIVAGLLANIKLEGWKEVLDSLSSGIISSTEQCLNTLELSYKHLPDHLKPCFIYFGAFPEDTRISVKQLIWLWIGEGLVHKNGLKSLEDVARDYIVDLIDRSLVMVSIKRSIGGVKACHVHDLLHDFCLTKAKEENFFLLLRGYDELLSFNQPCRRLCIYSKQKHFKESKLFCPHVRSLIFFDQNEWYEMFSLDISFIIHSFKLLRVLNIWQINLGPVFPSEMELLVLLRYLSVQGEMDVIPSSVGNLKNLEIFSVYSLNRKVSLPNTLWNLQKLRHLYIRVTSSKFVGFSLPTENLDDCSYLYELDSFSGAMISSWQSMENQMRKFPNIRKLKCKIFEYDDVDTEKCSKVVVPEFLSRLESLDMSLFDVDRKHIEFEFDFPTNLKKLTLSLFGFPWSKISSIGKLHNLEVLKLVNGAFSGETWEMEEGEFSKLRFLKLASLDIVRWTASEDQLPNLQKLVLKTCNKVEEIPSCFENISTLEVIEVSSCSESISSLVEQIRDVQTEMGNADLKVLITHVMSKSS